jgi:hypothetical protein
VSPFKVKITSKNMLEKPTNTPIIYSLCMVATTCFGITLPSSGSIQNAPETLPEDGNVTPKHVGATIHN